MSSHQNNGYNNRALITAFMLFAQLFLFASDALAFDNFFENSSESHHEVCVQAASVCQPDNNSVVDTGPDNCDHCCSCHGHFTHIVLFKDTDSHLGTFGEMALAAYRPSPPSHLQPGIHRPPRA
ncbi:hypothetical protein [Salinimonas sediminis]|uniref:DUF2946 domain-containing protein n=1 Tax=Salinimonas sediminis TaxID=2303538 RepID=A0A346NJ65_9ALTE|nr:hypothetical protein [Salinimonas sediminis]AXR05572.1 hypothetical protein D0Y50_03795 [Salinimonas sediminis]